jgi:hypothetical protein
MCVCLGKCLLGILFGWAIFFLNIGAIGALVAGAFAPWITYKGDVTTYFAGYGALAKTSVAGLTIPSAPVLISDISALLDCAAKVPNSDIKWPSNSVSVFYLGVVTLTIAAGFIAFFVVCSAVTCLCQCLSPCCQSPKFNVRHSA